MKSADTPAVLIAGAGPTGLVLALFLTKLGVRVRIIDKTDGPGTTSRAMVVHARTLEFYRQVGLSQRAVDGGIRFTAGNLWVKGNRAGRIEFGDIGVGLSPYPFILIFPQDEHERVLVEALGQLGVKVERNTEFLSYEENAGVITAHIKKPGGAFETIEVPYLFGCDGAHSTVRKQSGVDFPGGTYSDIYYVADIEGEGPPLNGELNIALDDKDFLAIFPMKGAGNVRLVGSVGKETAGESDIQWEDVSNRVIERLRLKVNRVRWFSTYRVHHRVASALRRGPVLLLGDAAHIHSPVGGQGMNTGIGDAVNLAWKIAAVMQGRIAPSALDTFEPERIAFARKLVNTTDRVFEFVTKNGPIANFARLRLVPFLLPKLFGISSVKRLLFMMLSQIAVKYPKSRLSAGGLAGRVKGGDRLPWVELDENQYGVSDNYAHLNSLDWQVHCYGEATPAVRALCDERGLALHEFSWARPMALAGLKEDALYLIRPDGYVGLAVSNGDSAAIERYLDEHEIKPLQKNAEAAFRKAA